MHIVEYTPGVDFEYNAAFLSIPDPTSLPPLIVGESRNESIQRKSLFYIWKWKSNN